MSDWISIKEFEKGSYEGWCWIVYKGRVVEAYRNHNYIYKFGRYSGNAYMTECITWAMEWERPEPPE